MPDRIAYAPTSRARKSDASATDIQVFAFGPGEVDWGASDPTVVPVQLDKKTYAIGDTATALIASPFERADVYFAVVRGDAIYRTTLRDVHGAARISFKIIARHAAECRGRRRSSCGGVAALKSLKPGALDTLARTGMAAFDVDVADRYLKLKSPRKRRRWRPGGPQRVDFALTNKNGAAAQGEIVAMVVNDAILQLSGYRLPDLVTTVFADQPISDDARRQPRRDRAENADAAGRKRLRLRRRISGGRSRHPRAATVSPDGVLRRRQDRRFG